MLGLKSTELLNKGLIFTFQQYLKGVGYSDFRS
jgi:hypothetical protein